MSKSLKRGLATEIQTRPDTQPINNHFGVDKQKWGWARAGIQIAVFFFIGVSLMHGATKLQNAKKNFFPSTIIYIFFTLIFSFKSKNHIQQNIHHELFKKSIKLLFL